MGTRHLTQVDINGETKIAQYGQWDGYIEGQGYTILKFLRDKQKVEKLKEKLKIVRFLDEDGKDKEFMEDYDNNCPDGFTGKPDNRTKKQKDWWNIYISRNIGAEILENIINSNDDEILLRDSKDFKEDTTFCEYYYIIDLDKQTLNINDQKIYNINNLPSNEEILKDFE